MKTSIIGSSVSAVSYISWATTLNVIALVVAILSGILTACYTIWKWNKERKKK